MRLRWTVPAADDLENIKNYLQRNYPDFAEPTERRLWDARAIVAKGSGGVMKNCQVEVTKVTGSSHLGT